jgi:hypothetical protein
VLPDPGGGFEPPAPEELALQEVHRDYLALEEQNTARHTDAAGHVITTIKPFPGPLAKLEDHLWSGLDAILDSEQQSVARLNLRLHAKPVQPPIALSEIVAPGFFGWGEHPQEFSATPGSRRAIVVLKRAEAATVPEE